ncbi:L,D-transpeptidase family protein [Luteolibacter marinus]|uniref:L,D-transpeptidase family protein n=1 Tax=Luteolibacter marinus TaxID=2776705 RepID=UPI00186646B2|nr:L,D-transpeptidase family protein [Luteolibacter marinus]
MLRTLAILVSLALPLAAFELPAKSSQCVVGVAKDWDSSTVTLNAYEKRGGQWVKTSGPWQGRLGRSGLVWGAGLHPVPAGAKTKREGDWRAPAGVFRIGGAWGAHDNIQKHRKQFYRQVTTRDLWVEDPKSPSYNQHVILDHEPATAWEKKQQMKQDDYPHSLKMFIAHNAPPQVVPGAGSAIFFHIWRGGGSKPTAGCTTMKEDKLRELIAWIDPGKQPLYVLLPQAEYAAKKAEWKLP